LCHINLRFTIYNLRFTIYDLQYPLKFYYQIDFANVRIIFRLDIGNYTYTGIGNFTYSRQVKLCNYLNIKMNKRESLLGEASRFAGLMASVHACDKAIKAGALRFKRRSVDATPSRGAFFIKL